MTALLLAAAASLLPAAAAAPCDFSRWKFGAVKPGGTPTATCEVFDLGAMPTATFRMNDSFPDAYAVAAPCAAVSLGATTCDSPAVQSPHGTSCGLALGMLRQNSTSALPSGEDGLRITMAGGSGGRTVVYDMICDKSASPTAGPSGLVGTHLAGFPNPALTYLITWRTPHACASAAPELLGTGKCGQTSVAIPTANQLRYQTGEIVALTHFNMASFVKNGDPGDFHTPQTVSKDCLPAFRVRHCFLPHARALTGGVSWRRVQRRQLAEKGSGRSGALGRPRDVQPHAA
jgi:hypothetical protein